MEKLEDLVGRLLRERSFTLTVAESCTGGLISHRLTNVPGSSEYFLGSFVTYSNRLKEIVLGVGHDLLDEHGAVSEPVAGAMAGGAKRITGADLSLAVTGVAGPAGGTREKPAGLVYIALVGPAGTKIARYLFRGSRMEVKEQTADAAFEMLREELRG